MDWMRQNEVNILKYLPEFLAKDQNFKAVADTCSIEHERIRLQLQDIFQQLFVTTATWGLFYWENVLGITPNAGDDYTQRRNRILMRYQSTQTTTAAYIESLVKRYMSAGSIVNVEEQNLDYDFRIVTTNGNILYLADMIEAINTFKPAHLGYGIAIKKELDFTDGDRIRYGLLNAQIGRKKIYLPTVPEISMNTKTGIAYLRAGRLSIKSAQPEQMVSKLYAGTMIHRTGRITIGGIK